MMAAEENVERGTNIKGGVEVGFHRLIDNIDMLEKMVFELVARIEPVLSPEDGMRAVPSPNISDDTEPPQSGVADRLNAYNDRIVAIRRVVQATTSRIDL